MRQESDCSIVSVLGDYFSSECTSDALASNPKAQRKNNRENYKTSALLIATHLSIFDLQKLRFFDYYYCCI